MADAGAQAVAQQALTDTHWISKALEVGGVWALLAILAAAVVVVYLWKVAPVLATKKEEQKALEPLKPLSLEEIKMLIDEELAPVRSALVILEKEVQEAVQVTHACPLRMEAVTKDVVRLTDNVRDAIATVNTSLVYCQKRLDDLLFHIVKGPLR